MGHLDSHHIQSHPRDETLHGIAEDASQAQLRPLCKLLCSWCSPSAWAGEWY